MLRTNRRRFLQSTTLSVSSLALSAEPSNVHAAGFWEMVRQQFPFSERKVPMNAANLCPSPYAVSEQVTHWTRDIDTDCSFNNRSKFVEFLETSREEISSQLGVSSDEIALVRNTSEANCIINNGVPLKSGDEVVVWDQNHPTNNVAWDVRASRFGFLVRRVSTPRQIRDAEDLMRPFREAITPRTRVLSVSLVSNLSGIRLPAAALGRICRQSGIHFHLDGAQAWGALALKLEDLVCDSFAASSHKWFLGPKEAGILYVRSERIPEIWPGPVAPGWGDDTDPDLKGARKFESMGQRDDACLTAMAVAADFHAQIGAKRVEQRILDMVGQLRKEALRMGLSVFTPEDRELRAGVFVVEVPADRRSSLAGRLYDEFGIAGAPTGGLRLSPHIYNTDAHLERAVEALRKMRPDMV